MSRQTFTRQVELPASAEAAFAWHARPGALARLMPPWERVEIVRPSTSILPGSEVELITRAGPFRLRWRARHTAYEPGRMFRDESDAPFAFWQHTHSFLPRGPQASVLEDRVEYELPGGWLGQTLAGRFVRKRIDGMFAYRHATTADDLAAHARYADQGLKHIAVTGASGLVGSALVPLLTTAGHKVTPLVRKEAAAGEVAWNPQADSFDAAPLEGIDAVVHLAGENIASARWTAEVKQRIRDSRVRGTRLLCEGLARLKTPPKSLVCASAIGYYGGSRGDELLDEQSAPGTGFLAETVCEWEAAAEPARAAGIRVVNLRIGVVLSPRGGALKKMLLPFKLGLGGKIGSGRQYWSWISIDDVVGAFYHALMTPDLTGAVNAVAPEAPTNLEFTKTLGRVLGRPTIFPMPALAAKLALGEMADELLLGSTRVTPQKLLASGYVFRYPDLEGALRHLLGKNR